MTSVAGRDGVTGLPEAAARRRGNALQQAIFAAVFAQLRQVGWAGLTMDGVAVAAHTGKAVLYRRWESKNALVVDAVRNALPQPAEVPVTGELRADVLALLRCMASAYRQDGPPLHLLLVEAGSDCRAVVNEQVIEPCRQLIEAALVRGVERGEVAERAANRRLASLGTAMIVQQTLLDGGVHDEDLVTFIDEVFIPLSR